MVIWVLNYQYLIEQEYKNGKITFEEYEKKKSKITEIIQIDSIYRFKNMIRWANITRMKKVSILSYRNFAPMILRK